MENTNNLPQELFDNLHKEINTSDLVKLESYPDPNIDGVYALQVTDIDGITDQLILHKDGSVEEVTFDIWPPRALW